MSLYIVIFIVLGALVGSFLNVVAYRLPIIIKSELYANISEILLEAIGKKEPTGMNAIDQLVDGCASGEQIFERLSQQQIRKGYGYLAWPPSSCPNCDHKIKAYENVPVLGWLFLKGRCSGCSEPISIQYPIVELITSVLTGLVAWKYGETVTTGLYVFFVWALVALTLIDLKHYILPDVITQPMIWAGLLACYFGYLPITFENAFFGVLVGYLLFWSVNSLFKLLFKKEGMGHGDFKLLAMLGAWLGLSNVFIIVLISSCVGAIVGIILMSFFQWGRKNPIPFGPYLAFAGVVALFFGAEVQVLVSF